MTTLNLKAFIQGSVIDRVVNIQLLNNNNELVGENQGAIDTNGNCQTTFAENITNACRIVITGFSVLKTSSAALISPVNGIINYDFSIDKSQALGNNQIEVSNGVFALYNGDFNQDNVIDALDMVLFENNEQNEQNEISRSELESNINNSIFSV